jgi:ribosome-associated translation inhibitor RaiA
MKLTLQHFSVRSTDALDSWVETRIFSLQPRLQIDEANIRLEHRREISPAYRVHVHLITTGPDVFAEGRDHTLRAAFEKVMVDLTGKINGRATKRRQRLRSNLASPASQGPTGRIESMRRQGAPSNQPH